MRAGVCCPSREGELSWPPGGKFPAAGLPRTRVGGSLGLADQ